MNARNVSHNVVIKLGSIPGFEKEEQIMNILKDYRNYRG
jgi:hypothetical protein